MSLAWPAVVNYWFSFILAYSRISHAYSFLFIIVINFCFRFDALTELGAFMRTDFFLCISVLRVASGPRVKLASCKSALNPRWFTLLTVLRRWSWCWYYSLLLCGLFYETICFMSYLVLLSSFVFQSFQHCDYLTWGRES